MKIELPKPLKQLLDDSDLEAPLRALADRAGEILADNKLPFFPDYTDHGTDHINRVLISEVDLVPKQVWDSSKKDSDPRLLCDADAAVMIGSVLLHDIGMHLRPEGFLQLVSRDSRFEPLPWFKESHEGHTADRPWHDLWQDYVREARRFSERDLTDIIGVESARVWKFEALPKDTGQWHTNHYLVIGEFIRRHHARLAHEIAIYGFPGLPAGSGEGQFPAMGKEQGYPLMRLADLIGLTARSHGTSLRVCKSYLESSPRYSGTPQPMGTAVLFPMALLRVADYLQIDRQRAPAVLLQLRNPQSPVSVDEWTKHRAVQSIGPASDPRAKMVTVSTDVSLSHYLQLRDLLAGLQAEMDHSTAVLDEAYGTRTDLGLSQLNLAYRRVYSNLQSPAFRDSLPYVPDRTGFTADPNLLTLLVEPLYGKEPGVGVRELMQNAVDAVGEREAWCTTHGIAVGDLDLPEQDADVLIEFIKGDDGTWLLRVRDKGIGMRSDTLQNYFLRAGASFRRSPEWAKEFLDETGQPRVLRAGHFGIAAFAVFLLGPSFRLWTRHAGASKSTGYRLEATANSQVIEIARAGGLPIGTMVEVEMSSEAVEMLELDKDYNLYQGPQGKTDWYCWDRPKVLTRVVRGSETEILEQKHAFPIRELPASWSLIHPKGFDAVYWTFEDAPTLVCNGIEIANHPRYGAGFAWPDETRLNEPHIAVLDSEANLPLTVQRYALSSEALPFMAELTRDVTLSFIAHALVRGPVSLTEALSLASGHPLHTNEIEFPGYRPDYFEESLSLGRLGWCATSTHLVPAGPWIFSLLSTDVCVVCGTLRLTTSGAAFWPDHLSTLGHLASNGLGFLPWSGKTDMKRPHEAIELILGAQRHKRFLGQEVEGSQVLISVDEHFRPSNESKFLKHSRSAIWSESSHSQRRWIEGGDHTLTPRSPLKAILEAFETASLRECQIEPDTILFVCEFQTKSTAVSPDSLIAQIWNECLGSRAIPFDPAARTALIADGLKHPELKRHIEAWQKMT